MLVVLVGCHADGVAPSDATVEPDAPSKPLGIFVNWGASPSLPGAIDNKGEVTVSSVSFQVSLFEVIGDAVQAGDNRVTHERYLLTWDSSGGPAQDTFPDAPAALYSKITLDVGTGSQAPFTYQVEGTWQDGRQTGPPVQRQFRLEEDFFTLPESYDVAFTLAGDGSATINFTLDMGYALDQIQLDNLPIGDDGVTAFGEFDPFSQSQRNRLHTQLGGAFTVDTPERTHRH